MKKSIVFSLLASILLFSAVCQAGSLKIVNGLSDMHIEQIYISRASTNDWEEDILGDNVLEPGGTVNVQFAPNESECEWDLKAVDGQGNEAVWPGLDLCSISSVTLNNGGEAVLE